MRILLTADPPLPVPPRLYGGIERVVADIACTLRDAGHDVGLVAHRDSGVIVERLYRWPHDDPRSLAEHAAATATLAHAVADFRPEVVHSFSRLLYAMPVFARRRVPVLMSYQREPTSHTVRWSARLGGHALAFTGCSEYIASIGRRSGGTWRAIPNCVDLSRFTFAPTVARDAPLVFLSRVERIKGAHLAIAIARAARRRLVIAGNVPASDEGAAYFRDHVAPHVDGDAVAYVGPVDDVAKNRLLGAAAAMVVPIEWNEPFGIVFVESLACGTPVIAMARGALPEIARDGIEGYFVTDAESGAAAVARIGEIDRRSCRQRVQTHFTREAVVARYLSCYRELTGEATPYA